MTGPEPTTTEPTTTVDPTTSAGPASAAGRARAVRTARLRAERVRLALVGTVLAALGVLGLLLGTGLLHGGALADPRVVAGAGRSPVLSGLLAALVGVVVAALGGLWLFRALRRSTAPDLDVPPPEGWGEGRLVVRGAALAEAARTDAEVVAGVVTARARLLGSTAEPVLVLDLVLRRDADVGAVLRGVEQEVLAPARTTVERSELPTSVHLEVEAAPGAATASPRVT